MPTLNDYKCDSCSFSTSGWEEGWVYVTDDLGKRIGCQHPGENETIAKVLRIPKDDIWGFPYLKGPDPKWSALIKERVGILTNCICLDCGETRTLDVKRDTHVCTKYKSANIIPLEESDGQQCPKCY